MQAKNRLRKGLACPVLMIYSSQDKALGPELVKARRAACMKPYHTLLQILPLSLGRASWPAVVRARRGEAPAPLRFFGSAY